MRIFYDHQAFSLQAHGGITNVFSQVIRYMNTQPRLSTDVLLGFSATKTDFRTLVASPGRVIQFGHSAARPSMVNYALNEALSLLSFPFLGKYDIYHNTLYRFLPSIRAMHRVATHHDCVQEKFPNLFPDAARTIKFKREMFRQADLILCVSATSRDDLLRFYDVPSDKTLVVYNGVSAMQVQPQGRSELRAVVPGKFLLYVGARHSYKNFSGLLKAYSDSRLESDFSLVVVGGGLPTADERSMISRLSLDRRVIFVPYASPALLAEAYAQAGLLVYPSLYEGFGMPPLEAASVGCVSLVASNPATREICRDGAFFFEPAEEEDFARMLQVALTDAVGRNERLNRARLIQQSFTWEECGRKTLAAYQSLE